MPYRAQMLISSAQFTLSLLGVGGLWLADTLADGTVWWEKYGLTGLVIFALAWVVKMQWTQSQKAQSDALAAKDALIVAAEKNAELHRQTSIELINATNHQTTRLEEFTQKLVSMDEKVSRCANQQFPIARKQRDALPP